MLCVYGLCFSMDFLPNGHEKLITVISQKQNGIAENREKQRNCKKKKKNVWIGKKKKKNTYLFIFSVQLSHSAWCNGKDLNVCVFLQPAVVSWAFNIPTLSAAPVSDRWGNHLTLTISPNHIDFFAGVIALKTATWGDWGQQQCQHLPPGGVANPDDFIRFPRFVYQQNERGNLRPGLGEGRQQKKAEPLICLQMKWADWKREG